MDEKQLPKDFLAACTDAERENVLIWWQSLDSSSKDELFVLLDNRCDSQAYIYDPHSNDWRIIPIVERLEVSEESDNYQEEILNEWLSHLHSHPETDQQLDISEAAHCVRSFGVCTNHPTALQVKEEGFIPGNFQCPAKDHQCPIKHFAKGIEFATLLSESGNQTTWLCKLAAAVTQ